MIRKNLLMFCLLCLMPLSMMAESWEYIRSSGLYYYGMGEGDTEKEAMETALAELSNMIATHVSNDFTELYSETSAGGKTDAKTLVMNCLKTYSQATLRNVDKWTEEKNGRIVAYCYMKRAELEKIYQERIGKAKDMLITARDALEKGKVDMALQYYYWSYSLLRSLQRPSEVKDSEGRVLINRIPTIIEDILGDITVGYEKRVGDEVDLLFFYKDKPVGSLEFSYNDGRDVCLGSAKDGRGTIEMAKGYETSFYHLNIEYEFKSRCQGDPELESILNVIGKKVFAQAAKTVNIKDDGMPSHHSLTGDQTGVRLTPRQSQIATDAKAQTAAMQSVIEAVKNRKYSDVNRYFTIDGLDMFNKLIAYGRGRVVGTPNIQLYKSGDGRVVARGMQMSFSFKGGTKKTFVEDVVFTFDRDNKIESVAFGLGQVAENDILCKHPNWNDETREILMEFLESYKTAYCLKRLDYIREVFSDDAIIIVGNVARPKRQSMGDQNRSISMGGQEIIRYNRYTKDEYLKHLERCFRRNEFINIRFLNNDIQWIDKYKNDPTRNEMYAIQIGQEYNSTSYGDKGYLFLLVDMKDKQQPQIKIRTWQPNEIDMKKIYNAGDFFDE